MAVFGAGSWPWRVQSGGHEFLQERSPKSEYQASPRRLAIRPNPRTWPLRRQSGKNKHNQTQKQQQKITFENTGVNGK